MNRVGGTLTVLRAWPGQRRFPYEPLDRQFEARDRRLRDIVSYASRHVPAYRALDPAELRSADDLTRLPLISRKDVLEDRAAYRSDAVREADALVIRTSGSSGEPLDVLHDRRSALANIAYSERERAVVVTMLGTKSYRSLAFEYSLGTLLVVRAFYDRAAYRPRRPPFAFVPSEEPLERSLEALGASGRTSSSRRAPGSSRSSGRSSRRSGRYPSPPPRSWRIGDVGELPRAHRGRARHTRRLALLRGRVVEDRLHLRGARRLPPARRPVRRRADRTTAHRSPTGSGVASSSRTSSTAARCCSATSSATTRGSRRRRARAAARPAGSSSWKGRGGQPPPS